MSARRILTIACLNFFTIGFLASVLGPALPDLAHLTGSPLATVGAVLSMLFVGALLAQLIGGPLNDRFGARPMLLVGLVCVCLGMVGLALSHVVALTLASAILAGIGHGAIDISTSVLVAVASGERGVVALNFINVFFGIGAIAGPAFAGLALQAWHSALPALWLGAGLALALLPVASLAPRIVASSGGDHTAHQFDLALYRAPLLWALGGVFLLYIGVENSMGGWIAVFVHRTTPADLGVGALVASGFWLALTGGRVLATIFGAKLSATRLLLISMACLSVGAVSLVVGAGNFLNTLIATLLLGLGCGPVFPTALAMTTARFPRAPGQAASAVIGVGSLGGIVLPWLLGVLLTRASPQIGMALLAALALGMLALGGTLARHATTVPVTGQPQEG